MKIISIVGARPNFMKMAPIHKEFIKNYPEVKHLICHTGQHYDDNMSKIFFEQFGLSEPDFYLGVGSGSQAEQTAKIMIEFEKVAINEKPDLVIVYGDVNSTLACSIVAAKLGIKIAHVEAGLRSFDMTMPEEINRILTDRISDYLFVTEKSGIENLKREGVDESKIFFVGNVMIDSLITFLKEADNSEILKELDLIGKDFILVTMHRPSNVDSQEFLEEFFNLLQSFSKTTKIVFPIHPRTRNNIEKFGINVNSDVILTEPIGYIDFLSLLKNAKLVLTDSGGIQEETTFLGVQCITIRNNTERPITVEEGTNTLAGTNLEIVKDIINQRLNGEIKIGKIPEKWDGKAGERVCEFLMRILITNRINKLDSIVIKL
ncbi:MAG: UDP-N-acetylglucosamine 2-epimerase (non-hydrolyzing) [Ignavibacterium sp.]|nr:UDP-N-acetylglucosamine 2-epimerase (non-hydrolyzing) [Ignavibacterium sp.]MDW8374842.1 UDP-N-acetylglucosamine 2-epimerase (non-hydrolyzing) [Ignavibacteriales bacterium]